MVHGDVRVAQELAGTLALARCDADAGRHRERRLVLAEANRPLQAGEQTLCDHLRTVLQRLLSGDHHELVAAEPADGIASSQRGAEPRSHPAQQLVAHVVTEGVVDALEVVQVDEQSRDRGPVALGASSICSTRSRIRARFGSPVSVSCVARNASSCWRLSRSVSALLRSCSKDSHIRTSVTFRLRLSIAYACSSVSGESCIRPAQSDVTSHAASHQRRQRLVTSLSGADRWAASWAKICQDSGPPPVPRPLPHRTSSARQLWWIRRPRGRSGLRHRHPAGRPTPGYGSSSPPRRRPCARPELRRAGSARPTS